MSTESQPQGTSSIREVVIESPALYLAAVVQTSAIIAGAATCTYVLANNPPSSYCFPYDL